jgi:hypothetical protein
MWSEKLRAGLPGIKFVDDNRWPSPEPVVRESIEDCTSRYVFLWPSDRIDKFPFISRNGQFEGPQSGVVMQLMRSRRVDDCLLSGQLGVGFSEKNAWMADWSKAVLQVLRRLNVAKLRSLGPEPTITSAYVVGAGAAELFRSGGQLKHDGMAQAYELA